jgi:hypothetical protein
VNRLICVAVALAALGFPVAAAGTVGPPVRVPFNSKGDEVAVEVIVSGQRLTFIVDTYVDPSVIDLTAARSLGLITERKPSGVAEGVGSGSPVYYPAELRNVQLGRLKIAELETVAFDMQSLSKKFGRPLHGILGRSFLARRTILIDYANDQLTIFESGSEARRAVARCRVRHEQKFRPMPNSVVPRLTLTIGPSRIPVSLDTGSALGLELFDGALVKPGVAGRLSGRKSRSVTGARGEAQVAEATLGGTVRLGPFRWVRPSIVLSGDRGALETRLGNLGNRFLRGKTLLLDYPAKKLGLYQSCGKIRLSQ